MASMSTRPMVASVLFFLLILVASEMGATRVAEARHCVSQSHKFKGACVSKSNCRNVCHTEGFTSAECKFHDFELKCFCKKRC